MVIAYWRINSYFIRYIMIYTFTLCNETNCGKFNSVYRHFKALIYMTYTYTYCTNTFKVVICITTAIATLSQMILHGLIPQRY